MRAIWNGQVLAESDDTIIVEGNHYFPRSSLKPEHFEKSDERTVCYWKGTASYFDIRVDGEVNASAAWYYPEPMEAASQIRDRVAFWRGV
ncbi:MAG: DUF427 domain-containing protein, partial [Planctomycetota bacterium]